MEQHIKNFFIRFHVLENEKNEQDVISAYITLDNVEIASHACFGLPNLEWKPYTDMPEATSDQFGNKKGWFKFSDPGIKRSIVFSDKNKLVLTINKNHDGSFSFKCDLLAELEDGSEHYILKSNPMTLVKSIREVGIKIL